MQSHPHQSYVVDSLPVPVCHNNPIKRCRIYPPEEHEQAFRGYVASKRRYFYGFAGSSSGERGGRAGRASRWSSQWRPLRRLT
jgi:hypothetical protein